jgi:methylase of polypeptide subunit release factors
LVEWIIKGIQRLNDLKIKKFWYGTGSGCIAISLAKTYWMLKYAIDVLKRLYS